MDSTIATALTVYTSAPFEIRLAGLSELVRGQELLERTLPDVYELMFVVKGELALEVEGCPVKLLAPSTLLLCPGNRSSGHEPVAETTRVYWVRFTALGTAQEGLQPTHLPQTTSVHRSHRLTELFRLLLTEQPARLLDRPGTRHLLAQILCEVADAELVNYQTNACHASLADRCRAYIRRHMAEQISTSSIAGALDCNPCYLSQAFKKVQGITPMAFLSGVRLHRARELLADSEKPVYKIAQECGFQDAAYFSRAFSREEGMSPKHYRLLYARKYVLPDLIR